MANRDNPRSGYNPKTGATASNRPAPNILANQAETSRDLQNRIGDNRPQEPFQNPMGAASMPTGRTRYSDLGVSYERTSEPGREKNQSFGSKVMSEREMFDAVGEPRKPQGYNDINNGFQGRGSATPKRPLSGAGRVTAGETGERGNTGTRNMSMPVNSPTRQPDLGSHARGTPLTNKGSRRRP